MNDLLTNEKNAIVFTLSQIMKADGIIHPKEEEYMNQVFRDLNITIDDLSNVANIDEIRAKQIIIGMEPEKREFAKKLFVNMAECDGYVHPREKEIIEQTFK